MTSQPELKISLRTLAKSGGVLYLIIILAGIFGEVFVRGKIIVPGDAAATAHNLADSHVLWRTGIVADLLMHVCDVPLAIIFYVLLRPVNKTLALLSASFHLVQTAVLALNKLALVNTLFLLGDAGYLKAFTADQLDALAYVAIRSHGHGLVSA